MKEYKKILFFMLMPVVLIFSNIIAPKITSVGGFPINANVLLYPLIYLPILFFAENFSKKDGYIGILFSIIIQIIFFGIFKLILVLPIENKDVFNISLYLILNPRLLLVFASSIGLIVGGVVSIKMYEQLRTKRGKIRTFLYSVIGGFIIDSVVYVIISSLGNSSVYQISLLILLNIVVAIIISVVLTILFGLLNLSRKISAN